MIPARSPPVSILFSEFSAEISMNGSTNSGETEIGRSPKASEPVVMFLTFLVDEKRLYKEEC